MIKALTWFGGFLVVFGVCYVSAFFMIFPGSSTRLSDSAVVAAVVVAGTFLVAAIAEVWSALRRRRDRR